jgi:hypothetical protein
LGACLRKYVLTYFKIYNDQSNEYNRMNSNRREFLKTAGLAGAGILMGGSKKARNEQPFKQNESQHFNMHGYAAPKLDRVRIGFVGVGSRGSGTVERMAVIEGVEVTALCDLYADRLENTVQSLREFSDHDPERYSGSDDAWKEMCGRNDIDLIYIATPWDLHAEIAVFLNGAGKTCFYRTSCWSYDGRMLESC